VADADTGLTYLNARYYDPVLGRFLSPDPLLNPADPRTLDPYRYADNNPVVYTDATGLWACPAGPGQARCQEANNTNYNIPPGSSAGIGGGALPTNVCYQFGSPCFDGAAAVVYQEAQALLGNDVNPWANRTCDQGGWCDSGGMYPSELPATAQDWLVLITVTAAFAGGMVCALMLPECVVGFFEFYATGGGGTPVIASGVGVSIAGAEAAAANSAAKVANSAEHAVPIGPASEGAWSTLSRVDVKGSPFPGHKGGSIFRNRDGALPATPGVTYREWDVNANTLGVDRDAERIVTGSNGSAYWTRDHYVSFTMFRGPTG